MRGMCAGVLFFEAIVLALATPVMIQVEGVSTGVALAWGVGLAALALVTAGLLRFPWAYALGWLVQVGAVAMGFLLPIAFFVGGVFAAIWATAWVLGRRIERDRAANPEFYAR
ncbi:DUF4233 domain-containing protein [Mumia sp. zg.B53]|uniref:DUF4233 domain-containing protein n=1 Tax=Mumia sp. zg.B53 TaxID=2855449 RepID=UPI002107B34C|nr:DUF4233 domain-containing protein [Mumia sp. zg.B53]